MATEIAKAYVQIIPSAEGISGSLKSVVGGEATEAGTSAGKSFSGAFGGAIKGAGVAIGAVATAAAAFTTSLVSGVSSVADYGDNIDKMSQKMGLSATAYQEWDAIMKHSGTSIESLQASMKTMANAVESNNEAFGRLGITQEQLSTMNNEELFSATITALQNVENETERTYLAGQVLGRGATELGALLNTSAEETEAMRQRVHDLGGVMDDAAVKSAAAFKDSLQDMQTAFGGLKNSLLTEFMPSMTTVMDGLTLMFSGDTDGGLAMIREGVEDFAAQLTQKAPEFIKIAGELLIGLVTGIADNLPTLLESATDIIMEIITGIIQALPKLVEKAPDIVIAIAAGIIKALPELGKAMLELVKSIATTIGDLAKRALQWGKDLIQNFVAGIKAKFQALKDGLKSAAQSVKDFLGFSEPKTGPLSNFHTFAPDMIDLFVKGIHSNLGKIVSASEEMAAAASFGVDPTYNAGVYGMSAISTPDYIGSDGQNVVDAIIYATAQIINAMRTGGASDRDIYRAWQRGQAAIGGRAVGGAV